MRGYWADLYFLGERVFDTPIAPAQRRVPHAPPRHICLLEGLTREDLEAPPPVQLDPEHTTHVPAQRYQEIYQQFGIARSYIGRLYSDVHERDLEIGRLRRHQSHQSSVVSRL
ncbi:hypothetical protein JCGZ_13463 [Jatropha curcas]|uniref:Aminotransferase-like plant mobile domain-containing protein n=1 Tax=Jatropha curcas TaxID=180498 RepID=A0A067KE99_JATCU|nr:hypothetical protein JCGZ_13463 [Jatropha curcas]